MDRTTWVSISRSALRANYDNVAGHARVPVCAVVKANAYGHGIADASRTFAAAGAAMLGVTRIDEARAIRDAGVDTPILIMMPVHAAEDAHAMGCALTVGSPDDIGRIPAGARVHLKVDTGMGRLGVSPGEAVDAALAVTQRGILDGIFTHLASVADASVQLDRFNAVLAALRHHGIEARAHAANSAATLAVPRARLGMVRIGTLLYGQDPPGASAPWTHAETFTWHARVAAVRTLQPGATVGYGSEWKAKEKTRVATIPVGYADGFMVEARARTRSPREVARGLRDAVSQGSRAVWFGDRAAPVIGRIAMQAITVSLAGLDDVRAGDVARIPARRLMVSPSIDRIYS